MNDYKFEKGLVKSTLSQLKKHHSQFTDIELKCLKSRLGKVNIHSIKINQHSFNHFNINYDMIKQTFSTYDIIEFNMVYKANGISNRVLLRGRNKVKIVTDDKKLIMSNICLVYELDSNTVITAYINECKDNHKTIDYSRYVGENISMDIVKILE